MKKWKDWLEVQERPGASSDRFKSLMDKLKSERTIRDEDGQPTFVQLDIRHNSTEEDIAKQVVKALQEMTDIVAKDMAGKYHHNAAKLKQLVAEEFYRQVTSPSTFLTKNFGDGKLVQ